MTKIVSPLRKFFVSPTGSDSNPGTQDAPWKTPEHAATQTRPGDWVILREGVYRLADMIQPAVSGTESAPIVFTCASGERAILDAEDIIFKMSGLLIPGRPVTVVVSLHSQGVMLCTW